MLKEFLSPAWERVEGTAEILGTAHTVGGPSWRERTMLIDGRAIHLTVAEPIFIESGDEVCVVGVVAPSGVLQAVAYSNRTRGVSGTSRGEWSEFAVTIVLLGIAVCGIGIASLQLGTALLRLPLIALAGALGVVAFLLIALLTPHTRLGRSTTSLVPPSRGAAGCSNHIDGPALAILLWTAFSAVLHRGNHG